MRRRPMIVAAATVMLGAAVGAMVIPAGLALAGSTTTHPDRMNVHNATEAFATAVPCNADLGGYWVQLTYNGQTHSTANANGFWITGTSTGTFVASPIDVVVDASGQPVVDPATGNLTPVLDSNGDPVARVGEMFTGRFVDWFGASINRNVSVLTDTSTIHGTGDAGTTFKAHDNSHLVTDGPGDPFDPATVLRVSFDHATCH